LKLVVGDANNRLQNCRIGYILRGFRGSGVAKNRFLPRLTAKVDGEERVVAALASTGHGK
jgi:hypothetical protein